MQKLLQICDKVLYWGIFIILIFVPLYFKFPLLGVSGTFVSVRLEDVLIAGVLGVWLTKLIINGQIREFFRDRLNQTLLLFFFVGLVSVFSGAFLTKTLEFKLGALHLIRRVELLMLMPLAISTLKTKRQVYSLLFFAGIVLLIVNLYALGQGRLGFPAVSTTTSELSKGRVYMLKPEDRVISTFAGHYDLAVYLLMAITIITPVILYLIRKIEIKKILKSKMSLYGLIAAGLTGLSLLVLIMTATRLSFFAAIAGVLFSLILLKRVKIILFVLALTGLILIYPSHLRDRIISTFTVNIQRSFEGFVSPNNDQTERNQLNIPTLPNSTFNELPDPSVALPDSPDITPGEPTNPTDLGVFRSFDIRIKVEWPRAIRAFTKNPLLGTGYSSIGLATDNDVLRSLGEVGILGTTAFGLILIEVLRRLGKIYKTTKGFIKYFSVGIISMFFAFLLNSLFIDVFEASKVATLFWILIGMVLFLGRKANEKTI